MNGKRQDASMHLSLWMSTTLTTVLMLVLFVPLTGCVDIGKINNPPGISTARPTTNLSRKGITPTPTFTPTPTPGRQLVWSDEFDGPANTPPDPNKWSPLVGGGGWSHDQLEYDTDNENVYQDGQGNLVIEARKSNPQGYTCWYGYCSYTSGHISTQNHFSFTYGRIEARMKLPAGQGMWPAFWLVGTNCDTIGWPACGEIDVMENIGREPAMIHSTVHGPGYFTGSYQVPTGTISDDFHVFTMDWTPDTMVFYIDGFEYAALSKAAMDSPSDWVYDHPFYIILNLAVGGGWPGNPDATSTFPQKFVISYMRVYALPQD